MYVGCQSPSLIRIRMGVDVVDGATGTFNPSPYFRAPLRKPIVSWLCLG
jgi:hypothetical protein